MKGVFFVEYCNNNRYSQNFQPNMHNQSMSVQCDMPIGMCYVPWQKWGCIYDPCKALSKGTMFVDLDKPFLGGANGWQME